MNVASVSFRQLTRASLAVQLLLMAATLPFYPVYHLSIAWSTGIPQVISLTTLLGLWWYYQKFPGGPNEAALPEVVLIVFLMLLLADLAGPAQYLAVALKQPLIDPWLAAADSSLGVDVPSLVAWTRAHPSISDALWICYFTLVPQFLLAVLVLGLAFRDRAHLYEYVFHFHFCLLVTLGSLALFPAECASTYYGFESTINEARFINHFQGLRAGTMHVIRLDDVEGLISVPSFHVAGGLMVLWAFRRYKWFWPPLLLLNAGMIAATFMSGLHYFVDIIVTLLMFAASVLVWRRWSRQGPGTKSLRNAGNTASRACSPECVRNGQLSPRKHG